MTGNQCPEFALAEEDRNGQSAESGSASIMPFLGQILQHFPGESITVQRSLTLAEDLHLADHVFVHAPGIKPLSACLPVVPMTVSLEIMAETAACLAPGHGLIGFEDVEASRWIELADTDTLTLRITGRYRRLDPERQIHRIATSIYVEQQTTPAISANMLFAGSYQLDLSLRFSEFANPYRYELTAEQVYQERHLFHGPSYQCLAGEIVLGDAGAIGELLVRSPAGLFRSVRQPQLLTDPQLLDAIGQIIGIWAMERERCVFPIGIKKLELYRPTPPAGTRVPVRVEITSDEAKTLHADIEIEDGAGAVWMRIRDWRMWKFRWERRFVDFRRLPTRYALSQPVALPSLAPSAVCRMLSIRNLSNFDAGLLARCCLHMDEMPDFAGKAGVPQRQQQWLLGRITAKDAVRAWFAQRARTEEMLHPAAFAIANDARGQPATKHLSGPDPLPKVSIAHCEDRAIAIADDNAVAVDIEQIRARDPGFLDAISTEAERDLLRDQVGGGSSDWTTEWTTRLWCAKETAGKLLGTGVDGTPRRFEAIAIGVDGVIQVLPRDGDHLVFVTTTRDGDFIIAYATTAAGSSKADKSYHPQASRGA
jgi:phosphopantetheinyl transferase